MKLPVEPGATALSLPVLSANGPTTKVRPRSTPVSRMQYSARSIRGDGWTTLGKGAWVTGTKPAASEPPQSPLVTQPESAASTTTGAAPPKSLETDNGMTA